MKKLAVAVGVFVVAIFIAFLFRETLSSWIQWCLERGFSSFTPFQ